MNQRSSKTDEEQQKWKQFDQTTYFGGTQIWFGRGVPPEPRSPYPFSRVNLTEKGTYFLRICLKIQAHSSQFLVFSMRKPEMLFQSEKVDPCLGLFL